MTITYHNGRWLVNEKRLRDLNHDEVTFLDYFFREMKIMFEQELINN